MKIFRDLSLHKHQCWPKSTVFFQQFFYECHYCYGFEKLKIVYLISKKCRRTIYLTRMTSPSPKKHCSLTTTVNVLEKSFVFIKTYSLRTPARYTSLAAYRILSGDIKFPALSRLRQITQGMFRTNFIS